MLWALVWFILFFLRTAKSSSAIYFQDLVCQAASGYAVVGIAGTEDIIGSLNGVFYTDATTSKPTFQNYLQGSNTATDIVAFINDDPMQMYEVMSADTAFNQNEVGHCADQVLAAGTTPLFISKSKISATTANTKAQLFIIGVSRDPDHSDTTVEGFALRVQIREHILIGDNTQRAGI